MSTDPQPRLLLVEDDPLVRRTVARTLQRKGYDVVGVADADEALQAAQAQRHDVALIDIGLPDGRSGIDVLRDLKAVDGAIECIIFTGDASANVAVEAYDAGAVEFFAKPITDWDRFHGVLRRASRLARLTRENAALAGSTEGSEIAELLRRFLVGGSKAMEDVRRQVERLAPRQSTVLLLGPTGAGKTRVAHALHAASGRTGEFVSINCGDLNDETMRSELFGHEKGAFTGAVERHMGAFERAADGTILLDEIGDLPLRSQARLLKVLEERVFQPMGRKASPMTSRVVAATHRDIEARVEEGKFREDLANRLGIRVQVPGLDARLEDIPQLVYLFLQDINAREGLQLKTVPPTVLERLVSHDWTGENLRGLQSAVERMAIFAEGDALDVQHLGRLGKRADVAPELDGSAGLPDAWWRLPYGDFKEAVLAHVTGEYVRGLLRDADGNVSAAARQAGLHPPNLRRLIRRYDIDVDELGEA